jgi:hypothetical protein
VGVVDHRVGDAAHQRPRRAWPHPTRRPPPLPSSGTWPCFPLLQPYSCSQAPWRHVPAAS